MIFGNPYEFSIFVEVLWRNSGFRDGVFFYVINQNFCLKKMPDNPASVGGNISDLSIVLKNKMANGYENDYLFNLPIEQAYSELRAKRFVPFEEDTPDDAREDYTHAIALCDMIDAEDDEIYLVSNSEGQEKILYKHCHTGEILECILAKGYVLDVMKQTLDWWNNTEK